MKHIISTIQSFASKAIRKGAIDIFASSFLNKIFMLLANVLVIRIMDPSEYGVFTYAYNIITIISIVSTLGIDTAMLQFCCEDRPYDERMSIAKVAFPIGVAANLCFSVATILIALFVPLSIPEGKPVLLSLAFLLPFPCILNFQKNWLRIEKKNKEFGRLTNIASGAYLVCSIILIYEFGLYGTVIGRYAGYVIPIMFGVYLTRFYTANMRKAVWPSKKIIKELVWYGLVIAMTNGISELLYYLDVYVVGMVTTDTLSIAYYKSATVIPRAMSSLPAILMVFVYPYFAFNKNRPVWVKKHVQLMQAIMIPGSILVALAFVLLAPWIVKTLYGADYMESVLPFRILIVSFIFSASFRVVAGNILAMLGKIKANFVMGCIECSLNIVLDYFLVMRWGGVGAAIATLVITAIGGMMCHVYLYWHLNKAITSENG